MTESQWKKYLDAWIARSIRLKILNEELEEDKCKQSSAHHVEEKDPRTGLSQQQRQANNTADGSVQYAWQRNQQQFMEGNQVNTEKSNKDIDREQVVLWAYEAGFSTNFVRGEVTRFEALVNLVKKYMERDYK